ncbi:MAG: M20 family metallo-hydrolase [Candidatus Baltobacteraceae bacterium]
MKPEKTAVLARLDELSRCGRYELGIDRPLGSPQERAARELFARWSRAGGYALSQDRVGNLFARRMGTDSTAAPILVGSHLDSVKTGGAYDGAYGVVGALCALELLDARSIETSHPLEAVAWVGEEGSRFPLGCLGSSVFAGITSTEQALRLTDDVGISLAEALLSDGGGLLHGVALRESDAVAGYLELHIEQGPMLDDAGASIGIVTAIAGQRRYRVIVEGVSGHAGTVPMNRRSDALCSACELILALEEAARSIGAMVVTVGRLLVEPNGTNVIPGRVIFSIDARSPDEPRIDEMEKRLQGAIQEMQVRRTVSVTLECLETRTAAPMHAHLREALGRAVARLGERSLEIASGAGHDAMCLSRIAPTAMLFVPSIGGHSHVSQEATSDADLELGVFALAESLVEVDRYLNEK